MTVIFSMNIILKRFKQFRNIEIAINSLIYNKFRFLNCECSNFATQQNLIMNLNLAGLYALNLQQNQERHKIYCIYDISFL